MPPARSFRQGVVKVGLASIGRNGRPQVDYCGNSGLLSKRKKELQEVERLAGN